MIARMATYRSSGDPNELARQAEGGVLPLLKEQRQAEGGVLPLLKEQPGFRAYSLATDSSDILSLSMWDSAEAEVGSAALSDWVRDNMSDRIELTDMRFVEVLLSTSLGVSTSVAATAYVRGRADSTPAKQDSSD